MTNPGGEAETLGYKEDSQFKHFLLVAVVRQWSLRTVGPTSAMGKNVMPIVSQAANFCAVLCGFRFLEP